MGFVTTQWPNKSLQATPPKLMKAAHFGREESCHTASYKAVQCGIGLERRGTLDCISPFCIVVVILEPPTSKQ
jgi:hypothetical protein